MITAIKNWFKIIKLRWILISLVGYSAAMFSVFYLIIQPQFQHYQEVIKKQEGLDETYINLISLDIEASIDTVERQLKDLETLEYEFRQRLLKEKNVNAILPIIDRYCSESHLKVIKLEPLNKTAFLPPKYQKNFLGVTLTGKYTDFLRLLQKLESNPEWILIETLTITPLEKGAISRFDMVLSMLKEKDAV
jgi:Tfp pilus assembly protein PilO